MKRAALYGAALLSLSVPGGADGAVIEVGKPFPLIELPLAGQEDRLDSVKSWRGRKVMLHLFASW